MRKSLLEQLRDIVVSDIVANFVETTQGRIFPPNQDSWKKPFGGIKGKKAKLDFAVVYNLRVSS